MTDQTTTSQSNLLELATELTIAWLANPNTRASGEEVPAFLQAMHNAVTALSAPQAAEEETPAAVEYTPAVSVRRSLASKDHLISLIDGKPYKTLKRHLGGHGLTPQQYRERYGLKADYPMVAASYTEMRRGLAKKIGLGRKPGAQVAAKPAAAPVAKPAVQKTKAAPKKAAPAPKKEAAPKAAPRKTGAVPKAKTPPAAPPAVTDTPVEA